MVEDKQKIFIVIAVIVVAVLIGNQFGLFTLFQAPPIGSQVFSNYWGTSNSRSSGSFSLDATALRIGKDEDGDRYRSFIDFDTSAVPDNAIINSVKLYIYSNSPSYGADSTEYIKKMNSKGFDLAPGDKQVLFNTLGSGSVYVTLSGSGRMFQSTGYKTVDLGAIAKSDLKSLLPQNYFSIALDSSLDGSSPAGMYFSAPPSSYAPRLYIDYDLCAGFSDTCDISGTDGLGAVCNRVTDNLDCSVGGIDGKCNAGVCSTTCAENQVVILNGVYNICHNEIYTPITDLTLLTSAEQQAILDQINDLNATIQEKYEIIRNLNLELDTQLDIVSQLNATLQDKIAYTQQLQLNISQQSAFINSLQLNLDEKIAAVELLTQDVATQAQYISQLELTQAQQVIAIESLTDNIAEQAIMINTLTTNLNTKIALVDQLTATNAEQQALIDAMQLSFADQQAALDALGIVIANDAQIIQSLNLNLAEQTAYIATLDLTNQQLSDLIIDLNLNLADTAATIAGLRLNVEDDAEIIRNLNLSLADQAQLITNLNLQLAEETELISNLRLSLEEEQILVNNLQRTIEEQQEILRQLQEEKQTFDIRSIWEKYQIWILLAGGIVLLGLLFGGKK